MAYSSLVLGSSARPCELVPDVIADGLRIEAVGGDVMPRAGGDVDDVDHDRNGRGDALIDGRRAPGRPAALRAAGDDELLDRDASALLAGEQLLHAIHRADGAFDHRQAGGPGFVARLEELVPGVGDEVVFLAGDAVAIEHERLVREPFSIRRRRSSWLPPS